MLALLFAPALVPARGWAQPGPEVAPQSESPRWWPAVSLQAGSVVQQFRNRVFSSDLASAPQGNSNPIRPPATGTSFYVAPWLLSGLELMGPAAPFGPELRPFINGGFGVNFGVRKDIGKERTPARFETFPGFPGSTTGADELEDLVRGQGSKITIQDEPIFFTLGAGFSFEVEADERVYRIKPSFQYVWEAVEAQGVVHRAVVQEVMPSTLDGFRLINLRETESRSFHGIGPGLEIESDVSKQDSRVISFFGSGSAYYYVGGRDFEFSTTNTLGETAEFRVNRSPWSWKVGVGLRIRFNQ